MASFMSKSEIKDSKATSDAIKDLQDAPDLNISSKPTSGSRQPSLVTGGVLKDYQIAGVEWLVTLYENGLNGILADEMGLGKTLQTIAFLAHLREKGSNGPFLIVAPLSTLDNWVNEFNRFTPSIPVILYHGTPADRENMRTQYLFKKTDKTYPIVVTSYNMIMNDSKFLRRILWKYVIVDEGHRLKNMNCKLIQELKSYDTANRLLLTGTPLQNNLSELWSLLNFLLPDIFHDAALFQSWFDFSALQRENGTQELIANESKSKLVSSLHAILKPFLLRRMKSDVELELPPKREYILYAPMTAAQQELYKRLLDRDVKDYLMNKILEARGLLRDDGHATSKKRLRTRSKQQPEPTRPKRRATALKPGSYTEISDTAFFNALDSSADVESDEDNEEIMQAEQIANASRAVANKKLQNIIMQLRLACNSPHLFYTPWDDQQSEIAEPTEAIVNDSGKMLLLDRLLPELFKRGHKVLIFSQFSKMLDIIEDYARYLRDWDICRLDGGVSQNDRKLEISKFNQAATSCNLFLLSTRAGGLGINLVSADTVILFDSDWNPQQDLQAMDRAHRIGQQKPVIVYRFATASTVEQTMLERADAKRQLEKLVIQKGKFRNSSATNKVSAEEELRSLLLGDDGLEEFVVKERGDVILTDEEVDELLDRSAIAYDGNQQKESSVFKVVEAVDVKDVL